MCLAIPARVVRVDGLSAEVDIAGNRREARIDLLDDVSVGDHLLVHAGFAITKLSEEEAQESLQVWREMADLVAEEFSEKEPDA